jgi:hypothetical protein
MLHHRISGLSGTNGASGFARRASRGQRICYRGSDLEHPCSDRLLRRAKKRQNPFEKIISSRKKESPMRIKCAIFAGVVVTLASWTMPALARHSETTNTDTNAAAEPPASSSCSALQQAADGSWEKLPCQELGSPQPASHKSAARNSEQQTR